MEHESPFGELALVCPDGQIVHPLDWQCEQPVPLLKNVLRLTAPNPGVMTGPGTNSYLVGDPSTGFIAIDPGPADEAHLEKRPLAGCETTASAVRGSATHIGLAQRANRAHGQRLHARQIAIE